MNKEELEKRSLEETFKCVDDILNKMSQNDLPLEESFSLYKEGMQLINHCNEVIDGVEKQLIILQQEDESEE